MLARSVVKADPRRRLLAMLPKATAHRTICLFRHVVHTADYRAAEPWMVITRVRYELLFRLQLSKAIGGSWSYRVWRLLDEQPDAALDLARYYLEAEARRIESGVA